MPNRKRRGCWRRKVPRWRTIERVAELRGVVDAMSLLLVVVAEAESEQE